MSVILTKTMTLSELRKLCLKAVFREPVSTEIGRDLTLTFDPELTQEERQDLDQYFSRLGYWLKEAEEPTE